ncbi:MAG: hypothetical protein JO264_03840, partial [Acidisphaera sp.]|nr:hypothetical protein [Acidisphaera sp.]
LLATGHSPAALLATLGGRVRLAARSGALSGFDLSRLRQSLGEHAPDAALAAALAGGSSGFDRLDVVATVDHGVLTLDPSRLVGSDGDAVLSGSIDLPDGTAALRAALHAAVPDAPELGLLLSGKLDAPHRSPEFADVARWRTAAAPSPP